MLLALLAELAFVGAGWAVVRKRGVPRAPSVRAVAA
jgi:hypothetical protein